MDERQRQFAQFASALNLNQYTAGNAQGSGDRTHRDRSTNDGRSSTGSTSSGSSSIISNNGNNVAAAVAAVAAGGTAAMWGELNRAIQYGYPPFTSGSPWPATQGGPDIYRLGNFGGYNEGGNDGRGPDSRSEGRRVPSKGETKATPPLPPGLAPNRASLASLQQLVNIPNEDVYKLIAAQQYAAAYSSLPPGANALSAGMSSSRHPATEHSGGSQYGQGHQGYGPQPRYRQGTRNVSPLSNASDRPLGSPSSPDNGSINGDYGDALRRSEDRLSPHRGVKRKDLAAQTGQIRVSPNLMPVKAAHGSEQRPLCGIRSQQPQPPSAAYPYEREPQQPPSGSESEDDQKNRSHRRKQHQPRRQTVIYSGGAIQPQPPSGRSPKDLLPDAAPSTNVDSSADESEDSRECDGAGDMLISRDSATHRAGDLPVPSSVRNPVASMSSAMSHALSHPFLAPHLNQPTERKFDDPNAAAITTSAVAPEIAEKKVPPITAVEIVSPPPSDGGGGGGGIRIASDLMAKIEPPPLSTVTLVPELIACPKASGGEPNSAPNLPNQNAIVAAPRTKKVNCAASDYCTPVKKRKLSPLQQKAPKRESFGGHFGENPDAYGPASAEVSGDGCDTTKEGAGICDGESLGICDSVSLGICDSDSLAAPKLDESSGTVNAMDEDGESPPLRKLVNGDHTMKEEALISPSKLSDDYYDCGKRRMRQKRPVSYVEDETDPVQETNEDAMPLYSPTRSRRGRRSKDKSEPSLSPNVSFPSITVRDPATLYEQPAEFVSTTSRRLLQDIIPEKVKEPLHIDTGVSQAGALGSPDLFSGPGRMSSPPDVYDFNDTDGDVGERQHKKRGRRRGSPRKSDRSPAECVRSSPRKESLRLPKLFPCIRPSTEPVEGKKESSEDDEESPPPKFPVTVGGVDQGVHYRDRDSIKSKVERIISINAAEENKSAEQQHNNNYDKKAYQPYSTISPTKLASLCQQPVEAYVPNSFHGNGSYEDDEIPPDKYTLVDDRTEFDGPNICNNNRPPRKRSKKRKRGRPKGSKSSPRKAAVGETDPLDVVMMADKNGVGNIPITEQVVNVAVAQFPSPRSGSRGRRKKRRSRNSFAANKSPHNNVRNANGPVPGAMPKNENRRNTQNSLSSSFPENTPPPTNIAGDPGVTNDKRSANQGQEPALECEGETMEDIEQFLKDTAPDGESTPMKVDTSSSSTFATATDVSSALSTPSTSDTMYRESRPKRISRPPPELPEGDMNDLLLLLNMDGEDSDDEDYVPRDNEEDPGSDSRLSLTSDDLEEDSDISPPTPAGNSDAPQDSVPAAPPAKCIKVDRKPMEKKKAAARKSEPSKGARDEPRKKTEDKLERRGPYVRLRAHGSSDQIVNTERDEDEREKHSRRSAVPFHVDKEVKYVKVGFNSTLHPNYNAFTKDMNWYCAFCKMYSHHYSMGDLFGPYFINSSSPSKKNYPTVTEGQVEETISSPEEAASRYTSRRPPRAEAPDFEIRKSELWESPPMRFVPSATPARMLGRGGGGMRTPERGTLSSPRLMPGSSVGPPGTKFGRKFGKNSNTPQTPAEKPPGTECWVHAECLLWSSGVTAVNSRLLGLDGAVISAQDSICSHCKESGATVCCLRRGCHLTVHVPCARLLRWSLDSELFLSHCTQHVVPSKVASK